MSTQHEKDGGGEAPADPGSPQGALSAAARQAQRAMESAKGFVAGADLHELGAKASDRATALYRGGRDLIANSDELTQAKTQLTDAIRKNPLAAVGVAFTAGLILALLSRR
jgi:ElaB/YqjD/DUF883 family membrane-anchored ribosome-binding protein